jgi:sugar/nucleoside kinase (ribokinase family)
MTSGVLVVGDLVTDTIVRLQQPFASGSDAAASIIDTSGGQASNVAHWLKYLGTPSVHLLSSVSRDDADDHKHRLVTRGITPYLTVVDAPPARIVAVVAPDGAERSFLTQRGASAFLDDRSASDVPLDGITWCHVSGYLLSTDTGRACYARLRTRCHEAKIPVSVDPASISVITELGRREFLRVMGRVAVLLPNSVEAQALTDTRSDTNAARTLADHVGAVVVTQGPAGALATSPKTGTFSVPAEVVVPVDPTGAGDAFAAGLIGALHNGLGLREGLRAGVSAGALAVTGVGAGPPLAQ